MVCGMIADCVRQALEGKDIKDLLLNIGSGAGAAPAAGGAAAPAADTAAEEKKAEEEKKKKQEEGMESLDSCGSERLLTRYRGGVGRGHGSGSLRLSGFACWVLLCTRNAEKMNCYGACGQTRLRSVNDILKLIQVLGSSSTSNDIFFSSFSVFSNTKPRLEAKTFRYRCQKGYTHKRFKTRTITIPTRLDDCALLVGC